MRGKLDSWLEYEQEPICESRKVMLTEYLLYYYKWLASCNETNLSHFSFKDKACNDSLHMPWIVGGSVGGVVLILSLLVVIWYEKRKIRVRKIHVQPCKAQFENKAYDR